jgi:hypothetical protein
MIHQIDPQVTRKMADFTIEYPAQTAKALDMSGLRIPLMA